MNYIVLPAQIKCERCSHIQTPGRASCSACGVSFIFGKPDAWEQQVFQHPPVQDSGLEYIKHMMEQGKEQRCLWEDVEPGTAMCLSCPCPRCSPSC